MLKSIFFMILFCCMANGAFADDFEVTGIIYQEEPMAIINGKIVKVGEAVNGAVVDRIFNKSVFLKYKGDFIVRNVSGKRLPQPVEDGNKKLPKEKHSKTSPFFFLSVLILILAGAGLYLSRKNKNKDTEAPVQ